MGKEVPCWGCAKRKLGCHGECEAYKHYRDKRAYISSERLKRRGIETFKIDVVNKAKKGLRHESMKVD